MEKSISAQSEYTKSSPTQSSTPLLCDVCQQLDIASLLTQAESQATIKVAATLASFTYVHMEYKSAIPLFFKHQTSLRALEISAKLDCDLCRLIWQCWSGNRNRSPHIDTAIDDAGQGQLYVGSSGFNVSTAEMPLITVTQRPDGSSSRTLCTFDIFADRDSPLRKISKAIGTPVSSHSDSGACKAAASEWLEDCIARHPQCGPPKSFRRPTRLINVGSLNSSTPPRLKITEDLNAPSEPWVALSYCWGGDSTFTLRSDTFQNLQDGIALEQWPATLRDAIKITQSLGLQYIWIDALCIMQDSESDWRTEAARMQDVYSGAVITIIASESPSTGAGIYSSRPPNTDPRCQMPFWIGKEEHSVYLRPSIGNAINISYTDAVQSRGWTLQEGLLAPRTLSFHKDQMVWECSEYGLKESGHVTQLRHMFDSKDLFHSTLRSSKLSLVMQSVQFTLFQWVLRFVRQMAQLGLGPKYMGSPGGKIKDILAVDPYSRWQTTILEYTRREFTKYSDTLPALGGIARAFATITKDRYCAGMWESELLYCLGWFREARLLNKKAFREFGPLLMDFERPTEYRAPSWSWASINGGQVDLYKDGVGFDTPLVNMAIIKKIHLENVDGNVFGQLKSGYLLIKGSLFPLGDLASKYWRNISPSWTEYQALPKDTEIDGATCPTPALHAYAMQLLNKGAHETFEFEQQHIPHPNQQFAAFALAVSEGPQDGDASHEAFKGQAQLLILETTGEREDEWRRIGRIALDRPSQLLVLGAELARTKTRMWREFGEGDWRMLRDEYRETMSPFSELEVRAWVDVVKGFPRKSTVRII